MAPCKTSTARAVILKQYGVPFAYTIEASNGNYYDHELKAYVPFTIKMWNQLGARVCESLFDYWMIFKEIELTQLKRKKERQTRLQTKGAVSRRIQSSSFRSSTTSNFGRQSKLHYRSGTSVVESKNTTMLN